MPAIPLDRFWRGDPSRRMQWVVHHPVPVVLALAALDVPVDLYRWFPHAGWAATLDAVAWPLSLAALLVFVWAGIQHMRGFCDACYTQRLGGPAEAESRRRSLWLFHRWTSTKLPLLAVVALDVPSTIWSHNPWVRTAASLVFPALLASLLITERRHARLLPWCPFCRDDGDGDLIEQDVPVPTGEKVA